MPTENPNPWKQAREAKKKSLRDADYEVRSKLAKFAEQYQISPSKLSRFENGDENAFIDPLTLAVLAHLYGTTLRDLDPPAAEKLEQIRDLAVAYIGPADGLRGSGSNRQPTDCEFSVSSGIRERRRTIAA